MRYLSLCAILRDEARYVEEWVQYHAGIGIEYFYLYENDSKDKTAAILKTLSSKYPIESYSVSGAPIQLEVYKHCIFHYRNDSRWIVFIDGDEFIVPKTNLLQWLKGYESFAGVAAHWYLFGSNGHKTYKPEPVVERFTRRQNDNNPHFKCFIDPKMALDPLTPHRFTFHKGFLVDEHKHVLNADQTLQYNGTTDFIQINHYATKSLEECNWRRLTARPDTGQKRDIIEFFKSHDRNEVEDLIARDIWRKIKCGS